MKVSNTRSKNYFKQVKGSVFYKVGAILSTFLAMPIMIKYLGVANFGVWSTMLTLVNWVMLFDLGVGNGLKNKISESLAQNKVELAASYISTAYGLIGLISFGLFLAFLVVSYWIPWQIVFNTQGIDEGSLRSSVVTLSFFIFFNFWLSLVNQIYHGLQRSSVVVLGQFVSNALALIFVYTLHVFTESTIIFMVYAYGVSILTTNLLLSLLCFKRQRSLFPSLLRFDKNKIRSLLSLGIKFFIIQLAVLVLFLTDKILITQLLGPEFVTPYEVLFKLFSVFTIVHSLILVPLWPAYSDAYQRGELEWIKASLKKQVKFAIVLFFGAFVSAALGPIIVRIWVGDQVVVSDTLYYVFALFIVVSVWNNIFAYFVNAINQLALQFYSSIIAAFINIPLSIFLVSTLGLKQEGVILATIVSLSIYALLGPLQVYRLLKVSKL